MGFSLFKKGTLRRTFLVNLIAGVRLMGPLVATLLVLKLLSNWTDKLLAGLPDYLNPYTYLPGFHGIGLIILILALVILGWITRKFTDTWLLRILDKIILSIPVLNVLYKAFKQMTEILLRNPSQEFKKVVLLPFPREGMYSIGFITGQTAEILQPQNAEDFVNVFLPTTPNPTSGFYIQVPKKDLVELDIDVEEALRSVVSAGIITPLKKEETPAAQTENIANNPKENKP